jgi:hypothetical protein
MRTKLWEEAALLESILGDEGVAVLDHAAKLAAEYYDLIEAQRTQSRGVLSFSPFSAPLRENVFLHLCARDAEGFQSDRTTP